VVFDSGGETPPQATWLQQTQQPTCSIVRLALHFPKSGRRPLGFQN
jgi:hypothetical protein